MRRRGGNYRSRLKPGMLVTSGNKVLPCMCTLMDPDPHPWKAPRKVELGRGEAALVVEKHSRSIGATAPVWVLLLRGEFAFVDELDLCVVKEAEQ